MLTFVPCVLVATRTIVDLSLPSSAHPSFGATGKKISARFHPRTVLYLRWLSAAHNLRRRATAAGTIPLKDCETPVASYIVLSKCVMLYSSVDNDA